MGAHPIDPFCDEAAGPQGQPPVVGLGRVAVAVVVAAAVAAAIVVGVDADVGSRIDVIKMELILVEDGRIVGSSLDWWPLRKVPDEGQKRGDPRRLLRRDYCSPVEPLARGGPAQGEEDTAWELT